MMQRWGLILFVTAVLGLILGNVLAEMMQKDIPEVQMELTQKEPNIKPQTFGFLLPEATELHRMKSEMFADAGAVEMSWFQSKTVPLDLARNLSASLTDAGIINYVYFYNPAMGYVSSPTRSADGGQVLNMAVFLVENDSHTTVLLAQMDPEALMAHFSKPKPSIGFSMPPGIIYFSSSNSVEFGNLKHLYRYSQFDFEEAASSVGSVALNAGFTVEHDGSDLVFRNGSRVSRLQAGSVPGEMWLVESKEESP